MIQKIQPAQLKEMFWDMLKQSDDFEMVSGIMPFLINVKEKPHYIYVKNISSAYFKERPDVTRAQLPYREDFEKIAKSGIPFIFMGYNQSNDVVVCWNPRLVQERLNAQNNVSLYSRRYYEDSVKAGEFLPAFLSNGDKLILFKRKDLADFLLRMDSLYDETSEPTLPPVTTSDTPSPMSDKITSITDPVLIAKITAPLRANRILEAMSICMEHYANEYPTMRLKDWSPIVRNFNNQLWGYDE